MSHGRLRDIPRDDAHHAIADGRCVQRKKPRPKTTGIRGELNSRICILVIVFFSSRRRHTTFQGDWSSDVCSSDLASRRRGRWAVAGAVLVAVLGFAAAVLVWSGVTLADDATALASVHVEAFGGKLEQVRAFAPGGRRIPLTVQHGRLTPRTRLAPGEKVSIEVVVRRPGWLGWALG